MTFLLSKYVNYLAWQAFTKSKDPAVSLDDFVQEAQLAIASAMLSYDPEYGTKFETHAVNQIKFRLSHLLAKPRLNQEEIQDYAFSPDYFHVRVINALRSKRISSKAKLIIKALLTEHHRMKRCSKAELGRITKLNGRDFAMACAELEKF